MMDRHLCFAPDEFERRRTLALAAMAERGIDGLLMFRQESRFWLTGYDCGAHAYFQCLYLGADGHTILLCRLPDVGQARYTSIIDEVEAWLDGPRARPAERMRELLEARGARGQRLGVEMEGYGCNARVWLSLRAALDGWCTLVDASNLIDRLRLRKSPAEIAHVRTAARFADAALEQGNRLAVPGAFEGDILAEMQGTVYRAGGLTAGANWVIGSGPAALLVRYHSGRRNLDPVDQLQLELAGVYHRYHACLMRTVLTGHASDRQRAMHEACVDALSTCQEVCRPGATVGEIFDAHARVLDAAGMREHRLNACGYSVGARFAPGWMDWPMIHSGNPVEIEPGMVLFIHMILADSERNLAMALGETVLTTENGCEVLSSMPRDLVVN